MASPYWEARAALRQAAYDKSNNEVVKSVSRTYDRTMRQLDTDIESIMGTYIRKTGLSPREAYDYLRSGVPQSVLDDLGSRVSQITNPRERRKLETILNTGGYRARISRLDAIKASTRVGLTEAAEVELGALKPHLEGIGQTAYSRMMYDTQKAIGVGFEAAGVPRKALDTILKSKWAGDTFSQSVWANRDATYSLMDKALMEMSSMGKLSDPTLKDLRGGVSIEKWLAQTKSKFRDEAQYRKYAANRLIRTESAYVANQTTAIAYEEAEIEQYEYISVLDSRTSQKCQGLDGKIFKLSEKETGVNFPPAHPFCRSQTAPYIEGIDKSNLQRRGRDKEGKSVLLPRDMNYAEWKRWQDAGCPDVGEWRKANAPKVVRPRGRTEKFSSTKEAFRGTKYTGIEKEMAGEIDARLLDLTNKYPIDTKQIDVRCLSKGGVFGTFEGDLNNDEYGNIRHERQIIYSNKHMRTLESSTQRHNANDVRTGAPQRGGLSTVDHEFAHAIDHEYLLATDSDLKSRVESFVGQSTRTPGKAREASAINRELVSSKNLMSNKLWNKMRVDYGLSESEFIALVRKELGSDATSDKMEFLAEGFSAFRNIPVGDQSDFLKKFEAGFDELFYEVF